MARAVQATSGQHSENSLAVAAVFRSTGDRPCSLGSDLLRQLVVRRTGMDALALGRQGDDAVRQPVGGNELALPLVPGGQDFGGRGTPENPGVDQSREFDVRDVARGAKDAFEIPDGLGPGVGEDVRREGGDVGEDGWWVWSRRSGNSRRRVDLIQESAAVGLIKDAREAPRLVGEWLHIHDLYQEDVPRGGALDFEGAAQVVNPREIHAGNVVGRVIVSDLAASPS